MTVNNKGIPASEQKQYEVTYQDLPLSCPMPQMTLWNSHPRVYLPIEATGFARCPYCGSAFQLKDFHKEVHHLIT